MEERSEVMRAAEAAGAGREKVNAFRLHHFAGLGCRSRLRGA